VSSDWWIPKDFECLEIRLDSQLLNEHLQRSDDRGRCGRLFFDNILPHLSPVLSRVRDRSIQFLSGNNNGGVQLLNECLQRSDDSFQRGRCEGLFFDSVFPHLFDSVEFSLRFDILNIYRLDISIYLLGARFGRYFIFVELNDHYRSFILRGYYLRIIFLKILHLKTRIPNFSGVLIIFESVFWTDDEKRDVCRHQERCPCG
jgi:hypothetical protein